MSGHSHFKSIKHQKGIADAKRGQVFSKISRLITIAVKQGGGDPDTNYRLRLAIEQAKTVNMPKDNMERAIKRGTGDLLENEKLEEVIFEGFGPGGTAIIIESITDNTNRAFNDIKQILNQSNGKLGGEGSVRWMFERKGIITINFQLSITNFQKKEDLELIAIEAGAEDIFWNEDLLDVFTKPEDLEKVKKILEEKGIKVDSASLGWVPKETIQASDKDKQACQKLFEALDENETVQEIYSNLKN